jgi:cytochrome c553
MRQHSTGRRLLMLSILGAGLIGGLEVVTGYAQTSDRHNPIRAAYMRAHFNQAMLLHDAVARGDLARARAEATILADISPTVPMPPGAEAFQGALTQAAREAAVAATLDDAAHATATLLGICGQCHKANHVRATVPAGKDIRVGGLVGHMLLHQRGVDDLLEGLVAPSDSQWVEGVRVFASPKLDPHTVPGKMRKPMDHGETALAILAGHAAPAQRTRDRVQVYGQVIATCGNCHRTHGKFAGPDRH